ncbi:MAG TPA: porin family protein [Chitinophagaceae bacterium]|nr:porin family protein [Chitinophagaceae bacterium]
MKKLLVLTLIGILPFSTAFAQGGFRLGLEGGSNLNKISGESFNQEFNFNYYLGAFVNLGITKGFGIQPEVIFSQSSATTTSKFNTIYTQSGGAQRRASLNYISIPILASFALSRRIYLQVGPQYGILINQGKNLVSNGEQAFKSGDFSMLGGIWIRLPFHLNVMGRYGIGLQDINNLGQQDKWKNQTITLGVGLTL